MAGYVSYPFQGFGKGLNLTDKPDAVDPAECIDALNVIFTDRGAIQQRPGYDNLTESALTNAVGSLEPYYTTGGTKHLLAGCGTRLEAVNTSGAVVDSETGLTSAVWDFARFGKPNEEVAFAGNGTDTLRKYNGTEWTAPTATVNGEAAKAMPKAGALCVSSDNRLVAGGFSTTSGGPNGSTSSPSHIYFSEAGNPEAWETNNFVQVTPGDGEKVQAVVEWKEFVFVFKETKFFVFYGTSTDSEGKPIFNYRVVDAGVGLVSSRAIVAHPSGIYFMSRQGVFRTTGQEPAPVSGPIEPIWVGDASPFYLGGTLAHGSITNCAMGAWEERIYLAFPTETTNNRVLVYDPGAEWWSLYDIPASCISTFRVSSKEELVFGYASGSHHIGRHSLSYTDDDGTAITSRWRSGWPDLGSPDVKTIRSSKFWGTGKVFAALGNDFNEGTGTLDHLDMEGSGTTEWGESEWGVGEWAKTPGLVLAHKRRAIRGTVFSLYLTNSVKGQDWSLHRADHHLRETRKPSTGAA